LADIFLGSSKTFEILGSFDLKQSSLRGGEADAAIQSRRKPPWIASLRSQ
jgi:hypothetical protein